MEQNDHFLTFLFLSEGINLLTSFTKENNLKKKFLLTRIFAISAYIVINYSCYVKMQKLVILEFSILLLLPFHIQDMEREELLKLLFWSQGSIGKAKKDFLCFVKITEKGEYMSIQKALYIYLCPSIYFYSTDHIIKAKIQFIFPS